MSLFWDNAATPTSSLRFLDTFPDDIRASPHFADVFDWYAGSAIDAQGVLREKIITGVREADRIARLR